VNLIQTIDASGHVVLDVYTPDEISFINSLIHKQFCHLLEPYLPLAIHNNLTFEKLMDIYLRNQCFADHSNIMKKSNRMLSASDVQRVLALDGTQRILHSLDATYVTDEDQLGYPNLYWRFVRSETPQDIGPLHRDSWFWALSPDDVQLGEDSIRTKIWIPLLVEAGLNGLLVCPGSHKDQNIKWDSVYRDGKLKPQISPDQNLSPQLVEAKPGQAIVFHDDLVHGGALNRSSRPRISMEFTVASHAIVSHT